MSRDDFEEWARSTGSILNEDSDTYTLQLFGDSPIVCPKSDTSVTPCLVRDFYWESWISEWFKNHVSPTSVFVDIGANSGYYSVLASHRGARGFAVEANPAYIPLLKKTSGMQIHPFKVIHAAVSDSNGEVSLRIPGTLEGSASIRDVDLPAGEEYTVSVRSRTLDSLDIHCTGEVIVKVDAEGAEEMVWDGAKEFVKHHSPTFIIEYTPGVYSSEFTNKLKSYGEINFIDTAGDEQPIDVDTLTNLTDWKMLVIRKREV